MYIMFNVTEQKYDELIFQLLLLLNESMTKLTYYVYINHDICIWLCHYCFYQYIGNLNSHIFIHCIFSFTLFSSGFCNRDFQTMNELIL